MDDKQYMRAAAVCALLNISSSCLFKWVAKGYFPRGFSLGPRTVVWAREDVEAWIAAKKEGAKSRSA